MGIIGSALGSIGGGLIGGLFKGARPQVAETKLGDDYGASERATSESVDKTPEQQTQEQMAGVEESQKPFLQSDQAKPEQMNEALSRRMQRKSDISTNQLRRKSTMQNVDIRGQKIGQIYNIKQAKYQLDRQQADYMLKAASDSNVDTNNAIGAIVGGLASMGGMALGGMGGGQSPPAGGSGKSEGSMFSGGLAGLKSVFGK